jgi:hypothetical protein
MWGKEMETELKLVYWKGEKFWVGKLLEFPRRSQKWFKMGS